MFDGCIAAVLVYSGYTVLRSTSRANIQVLPSSRDIPSPLTQIHEKGTSFRAHAVSLSESNQQENHPQNFVPILASWHVVHI